MATLGEWTECRTKSGIPLRLETCNQYRALQGLPPLERSTVQSRSPESQWNPSQPSRGLGDTIAKVTHAIGLDVVAESIAKAVTGKGCGCKRRQAALNAAVPYGSVGKSGPSAG